MNHSTILRVIGQNLEPVRPETYEVVCYGNSYLVRCRVKDTEGKKDKEKQVRGIASFLRLWRDPESPVIRENPNAETFMNVEFLYSVEELASRTKSAKNQDVTPMQCLTLIACQTLFAQWGSF
jgi:hypothetical protein